MLISVFELFSFLQMCKSSNISIYAMFPVHTDKSMFYHMWWKSMDHSSDHFTFLVISLKFWIFSFLALTGKPEHLSFSPFPFFSDNRLCPFNISRHFVGDYFHFTKNLKLMCFLNFHLIMVALQTKLKGKTKEIKRPNFLHVAALHNENAWEFILIRM